MFRTDVNRNPAAFTTDLAKQAGLKYDVDYIVGTQFPPVNGKPVNLFTAKLMGDPVEITIQLLDTVGYYTKSGAPRWTYIAIPTFIWRDLTAAQKRQVVAFHYQNEGGTEMKGLFA